MSSLTLYEISNQYQRALQDLTDNEELPEEVIRDTLEGLEGEVSVKLQNVSAYMMNLEIETQMVEEAASRIAARAKQLKKKVDWYKHYLLSNMESCGISEIKCPEFCVQMRENPVSLIVDDESKIPKIYFTAKTTYQVDKNGIKEAMKDGEKVPGVHLERKKNLVIT